jgi:apolipoprotein N-acyltransferase
VNSLCDLAREYDVVLLLGVFADGEEGAEYNAMCVIDEQGTIWEQIYAKRHLVPFGEYVPMRDLIMTVFPPLGEIAMLEYDLLPGDDSNLFTIDIEGAEINIGGLICFDSIYEELAYDSAFDGAELICVSTNDSWFEDSRAVYMHCAQSRLRAIETGLPILRAANTGISAGITSLGEVRASLEPLIEGYMISEVSVSGEAGNTNIGNSVFLILCFLSLVALPAISIAEILLKKK